MAPEAVNEVSATWRRSDPAGGALACALPVGKHPAPEASSFNLINIRDLMLLELDVVLL